MNDDLMILARLSIGVGGGAVFSGAIIGFIELMEQLGVPDWQVMLIGGAIVLLIGMLLEGINRVFDE